MTWLGFKNLFGFPVEERYRNEIENSMIAEAYCTEMIMCTLILFMQAMMILLFLQKPGGPFLKPRRTSYFLLYIALFAVTVAFMGLIRKYRKQEKGAQTGVATNHLRAATAYSTVVCLWACAITLLDQIGGNGLVVFSYMVPALAALTILQPWISTVVFGGSCILLNILLPCFPEGVHNLFSNLVNSICITMLSIFISTSMYRGKVFAGYDRIIIREQYEEIQKANKQLRQLAMTDQLTGLYNRRYLEDVMQRTLAAQQSQNVPIAGLMLDIDHFKAYNDHYGHQAGDDCLRQIAQELQRLSGQEYAYVVRYGGEEFFICLFGCTEEEALTESEGLRAAIASRKLTHEKTQEGYVTVSIGVCALPAGQACNNLSKLVHDADNALYHAKERGRNQVSLYSESAAVF